MHIVDEWRTLKKVMIGTPQKYLRYNKSDK